MKKFPFIGSALLLAMVVTFLSMGCQKESAADAEATQSSSDMETINATELGSSTIIGLIPKGHADQMAAAFAKKHPTVVTTSVGYSTKNLIAYLNNLLAKQKADSVFVHFGLYDKNTAPSASFIGRSTIFFVGKSSSKNNSGNTRTLNNPSRDDQGNYMNMGHLVP